MKWGKIRLGENDFVRDISRRWRDSWRRETLTRGTEGEFARIFGFENGWIQVKRVKG